MINSSFEFLSISYIVTEGLILFLYGILQDYGLADTQKISDSSVVIPPKQDENIVSYETVKFFSSEQIDNILNNWKAVETLSQREKEVLRFILENKKRKDIAQTLFVTESTIKKHTSGIFRKLEITNRTELFEKGKDYCSNN
ncbi:MAG: helix-turn-helix transcriptional regulator [Clostridia bacterium]|nr:helix-turn-helix transcriptional regulator [Clostridia bacterium]